MPAQHRQSWLDQCSDRLGLLAGRSGVISDKNAQNSKILSGQIRGISKNFGIKHLWGLSGVLQLVSRVLSLLAGFRETGEFPSSQT